MGGKQLHVLWIGGMTFMFQSSPVFCHVKIYLYELSVASKNCYCNYIGDESKLFRENWGVGLAGNHLYGLFAKGEEPGKHTCC